MVISLITANNVILPAFGPTFLMYMLIKKHSVEKNLTTSTSVTLHLPLLVIWKVIWKHTLANSATNAIFATMHYAVSETRDLSWHPTTHNGEKPHKCYLCKYSASLEGNLKQHMKIYHQWSIFTHSTYHKLPW